jgi:hypothetical protein
LYGLTCEAPPPFFFSQVLLTKFPSLPPSFQQTPNAVEELKIASKIALLPDKLLPVPYVCLLLVNNANPTIILLLLHEILDTALAVCV